MKHSEIQILVSQCSHLPVEREEAVAVGNHAPPPLVHHCGRHGEEGDPSNAIINYVWKICAHEPARREINVS